MIVDSKISARKTHMRIPVALRKELDSVIVRKKITDVVAFMDRLGKDVWGKDPSCYLMDKRNNGGREVWGKCDK